MWGEDGFRRIDPDLLATLVRQRVWKGCAGVPRRGDSLIGGHAAI